MLHDEKVYPNPMRFDPERFLDGSGNINTDVQNPSTAAFGFGRRCIARVFRQSSAADSESTTISESVPVGISPMQPFG